MPKKQEIIHVAYVAQASHLAFCEVIERVHVTVRPELAREVSDGKASRPVRGEEIVSGEVDHFVLFPQDPDAARKDPVDEPADVGFLDLSGQDLSQYRVVDAREELPDVALQYVRIAAGESLHPVERPVRPLSHTVRIGVCNERALEYGLYEVAEGVVDYPVAERRGGDQAPLRLVDKEARVWPWMVGPAEQFFPQFEQVVFETILEGGHIRMAALALRGLAVREKEIVPRAETFIHGSSEEGPAPR